MYKLCCTVLVLLLNLPAAMAVGVDDGVPRLQLPRNVAPERYTLDLRVDPAQTRFGGEVRIAVRIAQPTALVWMHGRHLDISKAQFVGSDGTPIELTTSEADVSGVLRVDAAHPLPAGKGELRFTYDADYATQLQGTYRAKVGADHYVITQMEAMGARDSFPCFDEPSFKTPWDVRLTVPTAAIAVANGPAISELKTSDGYKRVQFATTQALPSYLIAYAVGPWDVVDAKAIAPTAQRATPLPLRGIAVRGRGKELAYALETTPAMVQALEAYFDIAFPFDKLDLMAAPDFSAGAMENAGLIVFNDAFLLIGADSPTINRRAYYSINVHELAHQWFGDLVTMNWWNDIWLNEGFANWIGTKITAQLRPDLHAARSAAERTAYAMSTDSLASTRRIREPIADFTDVQAAFDGITYSKGAAVLSMFEAYLGPDRFRDGVRAYLRAHARDNASSDDLITALAARGDNAARFTAAFSSFLEQPGVPMLDFKLDCRKGKAHLAISQQRFVPLGSSAERRQTWGVPVCMKLGDAHGVSRFCTLITQTQTDVALPGDHCPTWFAPNADGAGYYRYTLAPTQQTALDSHFAELNELEQRAHADALSAAFDYGSVTLQAYAQAAARLIGADTREVIMAPSGRLDWMVTTLAREEAQREAVRAYLVHHYGPLLKRVGLDARADDDDDARLLRASVVQVLSEQARDSELQAELASRARRYLGIGTQPDDNALAPDLRDKALLALAQIGTAEDFDALIAALRKSQDSQERWELISAIGAAISPPLQAKGLALTLSPAIKPEEMLSLLFNALALPDTRVAADTWVREHLDALIERLPVTQKSYVSTTLATAACSDAAADDMHRLLSKRVAHLEGGPRTLKQAEETVRLCAVKRTHYDGQDMKAAFTP